MHDFAMNTALCIARPLYVPMSLAHVQNARNHYAGFMSFSWGIISDIGESWVHDRDQYINVAVDIGSEEYRRSLGSARFAVFGYLKTMARRTYRGRLSYLPARDHSMPREYFRSEGITLEPPKHDDALNNNDIEAAGAIRQT
jgi:hypothetical protein